MRALRAWLRRTGAAVAYWYWWAENGLVARLARRLTGTAKRLRRRLDVSTAGMLDAERRMRGGRR